MHKQIKFIYALLVITIMSGMIAGFILRDINKNYNEYYFLENNKKINNPINKNLLSIEIFSDIPAKFDGGHCIFSNNLEDFKEKKYIYANNFGHTSFMKINGVMTEFTETEFEDIEVNKTRTKLKNDNLELILNMETVSSGYEMWSLIGTLVLTNINGDKIIKTFYGECGF